MGFFKRIAKKATKLPGMSGHTRKRIRKLAGIKGKPGKPDEFAPDEVTLPTSNSARSMAAYASKRAKMPAKSRSTSSAGASRRARSASRLRARK